MGSRGGGACCCSVVALLILCLAIVCLREKENTRDCQRACMRHALSSVCLTWPRVCGTGSPGPSSGPRARALSPSVAVCLLCWIGEAAHLKECIKSSHLAALLRFRVCAQDLQVSRAHARLRAERVCRMCMAGPVEDHGTSCWSVRRLRTCARSTVFMLVTCTRQWQRPTLATYVSACRLARVP